MRTGLVIGMIVLLIAALGVIVYEVTAKTPDGPQPLVGQAPPASPASAPVPGVPPTTVGTGGPDRALPPGVPGSGTPGGPMPQAPKLP